MATMKKWLFIAGINGALAVLAGAFAAHALGSRLDPAHAAAFATAAHYHLVHAVAMAVAALAARGAAKPRAQNAALLFLAGIVLFCGSLYMLVLTGIRLFRLCHAGGRPRPCRRLGLAGPGRPET